MELTTEMALEDLRLFKEQMDITNTSMIDMAIKRLLERGLPHKDTYGFEYIDAENKEDFILKQYLLVIKMHHSNAHGDYNMFEVAEILMSFSFALATALSSLEALTVVRTFPMRINLVS